MYNNNIYGIRITEIIHSNRTLLVSKKWIFFDNDDAFIVIIEN